MAATKDTEYYRARALDLQVTGYHAAVHALLDMNPDGFLDRSNALQVLMDRMTGYAGIEAAQDTWEVLRDQASKITGVRHGPLHSCVKEQVLGRLTVDLFRLVTAPRLVTNEDAFVGLPR